MKRGLALVCSLWLCACVSLDEAPRKNPDSSDRDGSAGAPDRDASTGAANGADGAAAGAGAAGQDGAVPDGATSAGGTGGSGELGGSAAAPVCGDGVLDDGEQCDWAIAAGAGACPTACTSDDACAPRSLVGSACDAHCETGAISEPSDGDGCCPAGADVASDYDCCRLQQRTVIAGENERVASATDLGDVTTQSVIVDGGSLSVDYLGASIGCGAPDAYADAVYSFVPSASYPLALGIEGGGWGAVYALFDEPPPAVSFLHAPQPTACQGLRLNGRVYFSCGGALSWTQAREHCAEAGLALARIDDATENETLRAALGSTAHWIGLNDRDTEGSFVWPDASAPGFASWAASNPDGGDLQDCVALAADGSWDDSSCDDLRPFVCELSGKLTGDTLPDATPIELDDQLHVLDGDATVYGLDRDPGLDVCGADASFPDGFIPLDLAQDATVEIDTTGSSFAPVIALYARSGNALSGDAPLGCHDSAVDGAVEDVELVAGSYALVVSGKGSPSGFRIMIRDVAMTMPGHRVACATSSMVTTFEPVAGKRYYAVVKGYDAYKLGIGAERCR